ncbi:MAG: hypothetical protein AB7J63_15885 [Vicinamibacterales bacterium]
MYINSQQKFIDAVVSATGIDVRENNMGSERFDLFFAIALLCSDIVAALAKLGERPTPEIDLIVDTLFSAELDRSV